MGRISNTFQLAKLSWGVLKKDRELLALPVLSFLVSAALLIPSGVRRFRDSQHRIRRPVTGEETTASPAMALVAYRRSLGFECDQPSSSTARWWRVRTNGSRAVIRPSAPRYGRAFSRISGLVPWAILTATVGMILRALRDRGRVGLSRFRVGHYRNGLGSRYFPWSFPPS